MRSITDKGLMRTLRSRTGCLERESRTSLLVLRAIGAGSGDELALGTKIGIKNESSDVAMAFAIE